MIQNPLYQCFLAMIYVSKLLLLLHFSDSVCKKTKTILEIGPLWRINTYNVFARSLKPRAKYVFILEIYRDFFRKLIVQVCCTGAWDEKSENNMGPFKSMKKYIQQKILKLIWRQWVQALGTKVLHKTHLSNAFRFQQKALTASRFSRTSQLCPAI